MKHQLFRTLQVVTGIQRLRNNYSVHHIHFQIRVNEITPAMSTRQFEIKTECFGGIRTSPGYWCSICMS